MNWDEKIEVKKGNIGEEIVDDYLRSRGFIPYHAEEGKAHPFDRLCASEDKKTILVAEAKTKPHRIYYPDTGIDIKHYKNYCLIRSKYNLPIWLFFVDEHSGKIYGNALKELEKPCIHKHNLKTLFYPLRDNGIIYFPLDKMKTIRELTTEEIESIKKYTTRNEAYKYE